MLTIKELALFKYGVYNKGTAIAIGKELRKADIDVVKIGRESWADVKDGTKPEDVAVKLQPPSIGTTVKTTVTKLRKPNLNGNITIETMARTIENMALIIAEKDSLIQSLHCQLGQANTVKLNDTVRNAVAKYGD